jgi:rod shape-determining protein MreC
MRRLNIIALVIFLVAVAGVLALGTIRTQRIQASFLDVVAPFLKTGSTWQKQLSAMREGLKTLDQLEQENRDLVVQLKELKATNQTLRDLEVENNKLRKALDYRQRSVFKLIPARIMARDASTWWNTVKIDRGFKDGIGPDMPVLTEEGLVGKTTTVADHAATVILISDETCKVAASIEGTREQGIVKGERTSTNALPELGLSFLSKTANLQPGQKVYSSGVGGVYPSGVFIGVIKEFKVRPLDGYATLIPAVDLTTLQDVFIIVGNK